jgi:hypothetical protein
MMLRSKANASHQYLLVSRITFLVFDLRHNDCLLVRPKGAAKTAGREHSGKDIRRSTTELPARNMDQVGIEPTTSRVTGEVTLPCTTSNFFCLPANSQSPRPVAQAFRPEAFQSATTNSNREELMDRVRG